jgi:hypothetical protein
MTARLQQRLEDEAEWSMRISCQSGKAVAGFRRKRSWVFSRMGALRLRKQGFTAAQRWAVWIVHGEKCYLDGHPIDLQSMQVDHVIPESLVEEPERLAQVLHDFGLASDFDLNSYENWMPACGTHNNLKRAKVFTPTPLIQMHLERAALKAEQAREIERQSISRAAFAKASNVVMREAEALGISTEDFVSFLDQLIDARRKPEGPNLVMEQRRARRILPILHIALVVFSLMSVGVAFLALLYVNYIAAIGLIATALAIMVVIYSNNSMGSKPSVKIHRKSHNGVDIQGIDTKILLDILMQNSREQHIQLTPTMSISFDRALELTGRKIDKRPQVGH